METVFAPPARGQENTAWSPLAHIVGAAEATVAADAIAPVMANRVNALVEDLMIELDSWRKTGGSNAGAVPSDDQRLDLRLLHQARSEVLVLVVADLFAHDGMRNAFVKEDLLVRSHRLELLRQHERALLFGMTRRHVAFLALGDVLAPYRRVTEHVGVIVRVLLLARGVDDLQCVVGDDRARD